MLLIVCVVRSLSSRIGPSLGGRGLEDQLNRFITTKIRGQMNPKFIEILLTKNACQDLYEIFPTAIRYGREIRRYVIFGF